MDVVSFRATRHVSSPYILRSIIHFCPLADHADKHQWPTHNTKLQPRRVDYKYSSLLFQNLHSVTRNGLIYSNKQNTLWIFSNFLKRKSVGIVRKQDLKVISSRKLSHFVVSMKINRIV